MTAHTDANATDWHDKLRDMEPVICDLVRAVQLAQLAFVEVRDGEGKEDVAHYALDQARHAVEAFRVDYYAIFGETVEP
jgi:hypothetical protein